MKYLLIPTPLMDIMTSNKICSITASLFILTIVFQKTRNRAESESV